MDYNHYLNSVWNTISSTNSLFHFFWVFHSRGSNYIFDLPNSKIINNSMAVSSYARAFPSFECRSEPDFSGSLPHPKAGVRFSGKYNSGSNRSQVYGLSSLIYRFPPNFVRQLSIKARRNCSNIGVAQVVAASWSNNQAGPEFTPAANAVDSSASAAVTSIGITTGDEEVAVVENADCSDQNVQIKGSTGVKYASFLNSDGSVAIHAGIILRSF